MKASQDPAITSLIQNKLIIKRFGAIKAHMFPICQAFSEKWWDLAGPCLDLTGCLSSFFRCSPKEEKEKKKNERKKKKRCIFWLAITRRKPHRPRRVGRLGNQLSGKWTSQNGTRSWVPIKRPPRPPIPASQQQTDLLLPFFFVHLDVIIGL